MSTLAEIAKRNVVDPIDIINAKFYLVAQAFNDMPTGLVWSIKADDLPAFKNDVDQPGMQFVQTPYTSKLKLNRFITKLTKDTKILNVPFEYRNFINKY